MPNRQKLLDAAARAYGEFGFRGATTRRIADLAGVNEVTLFRLFGSKSALLNEAIRQHAPGVRAPDLLPEHPVDPPRELADWCTQMIAHLRAHRSVIRKAMSEMEEHPEIGPCVSEGPLSAYQSLQTYARQLRVSGRALSDPELAAATSMLISAAFGDAMGRELMPTRYPQPEADAGRLYALMFLRMLGYSPVRRHRRAAAGVRGRHRSSGTDRRS
jgi:AcrR family transcriptional regulator